MGNYYYLMAQLPAIPPIARPAMSYAQFKEIASHHLSRKDALLLENLSLMPRRGTGKSGSSFIDRWNAHECALRFSLERLRASKLGRQTDITAEEDELVSAMPDTRQIASTALAMDNPLEAERYLDRARIAYVEYVRGIHSFDSESVFAYALTLLLRERRSFFVADEGRASYTGIYNQILGEQK